MAHFKRRRPKNQRSGCLYCKPHKANGAKNKEAPAVKRKLQEDQEYRRSVEARAGFEVDW